MKTMEERLHEIERLYAVTLAPHGTHLCPRCGSVGHVFRPKIAPLSGDRSLFILWVAPDGSDAKPDFSARNGFDNDFINLWHDAITTIKPTTGCGYDSKEWVARWKR